MERDHERDLPVPRRTIYLPQISPRLLNRRLDVVEAVKRVQVVKGGGDRCLVLVLRRQ
jgi:hypothetical protein